jgi:hypothetical protein
MDLAGFEPMNLGTRDCVLDLIELVFNGWPEGGLLRPKHVATPNIYFNMILVLCLTDSSVDIILLSNTTGWTTL